MLNSVPPVFSINCLTITITTKMQKPRGTDSYMTAVVKHVLQCEKVHSVKHTSALNTVYKLFFPSAHECFTDSFTDSVLK